MIAGLLFDRYRLAGDHRLVDRAAAAQTAIVCGFLGCNLQPFNPVIATLPGLLHLRAPGDGGWIAQFRHQAVAESQAKPSPARSR